MRLAPLALLLSGCFHPGHLVTTTTPLVKYVGPRVVAISCPTPELEEKVEALLRKNGFRVKRVREPIHRVEVQSRYVLQLSGEVSGRCEEGGFVLGALRAETVDLEENETVWRSRASGPLVATEDCWKDGTIFRDLLQHLRDNWATALQTQAAPDAPPASPTPGE